MCQALKGVGTDCPAAAVASVSTAGRRGRPRIAAAAATAAGPARPQTPEHLKTPTAEEAFNPDGLAQRTIRLLKDKFPDLEVGDWVGWWAGGVGWW